MKKFLFLLRAILIAPISIGALLLVDYLFDISLIPMINWILELIWRFNSWVFALLIIIFGSVLISIIEIVFNIFLFISSLISAIVVRIFPHIASVWIIGAVAIYNLGSFIYMVIVGHNFSSGFYIVQSIIIILMVVQFNYSFWVSSFKAFEIFEKEGKLIKFNEHKFSYNNTDVIDDISYEND